MARVRHTAEVRVSEVVYLGPTKPRATPTSVPLTKKQMNSLAVQAALKIADGDASRLRFEEDGSIIVANKARTER